MPCEDDPLDVNNPLTGDMPPVSTDQDLTHSRSSDDSSSPAYPRVEGYHITRCIGQGGMGTVWQARQLTTGRNVAIKMLRGSAFGATRARTRFKREIEILATLEHPHIARLYHFSVDTHIAYYVMEYVDGISINTYCRYQNFNIRQTLSLFAEVCRAVDYAQRSGFIHRDLKPSNILVRNDNRPCLLDFGLAKSLSSAKEHPTLTLDGDMTGTVAYMAPEQAAGNNNQVDSRSDVFSLGIILYELFAGRLPHDVSGSTYEIQNQIIEKDAPSCREFNTKVDRELDAVISKAISRCPEDRYRSAGELASDLDNYLLGNPLTARPLTLAYLLRKRIIQHRTRWVVGILLFVSFTAIVSYASLRVNTAQNLAETRAAERSQALYVSRFTEAQRAFTEGDIGRATFLLERCSAELRHWEWDYLSQLADQSLTTFELPAAPRRLAIRDDAAVAWAVDRDGMFYEWSKQSRQITTKNLVMSDPHRVELSADGQYAAYSTFGRIEVVHTQTLERSSIPMEEAVEVIRMAISPHGDLLAIVTDQNAIQLWATLPQRLIHSIADVDDVKSLMFFGETLVYSRPDGTFVLVERRDDQTPRQDVSQGLRPVVMSMRYRDTGLESIAVNAESLTWARVDKGMIHIAQPSKTLDLRGHALDVNRLQISVNGQFAISSASRTIKLWSLKNQIVPIRRIDLPGGSEFIFQARFDPIRPYLTFSTAKGYAHLVDLTKENKIVTYDIGQDFMEGWNLWDVVFSQEGHMLWGMTTRHELIQYDKQKDAFESVEQYQRPCGFSADGRYVIAQHKQQSEALAISSLENPTGVIATLFGKWPWAWSSDGRFLVTFSHRDDSQLVIWKTDHWKKTGSFQMPHQRAANHCWSVSPRTICCGSG